MTPQHTLAQTTPYGFTVMVRLNVGCYITMNGLACQPWPPICIYRLCSANVDHLRLCDLTLHICWNVGYCVLMSCHLLCTCASKLLSLRLVSLQVSLFIASAQLSLQRNHSVYLVASPDWCWPMSPATADSVTLIQNACDRMHRDACSRKCLGSKLTKTQLLEGLLKSAQT